MPKQFTHAASARYSLLIIVLLTVATTYAQEQTRQVVRDLSPVQSLQQQAENRQQIMQKALENALLIPPSESQFDTEALAAPITKGVRILGVETTGGKIVVNISKEVLEYGSGARMDQLVRNLLDAIDDILPAGEVEFIVHVEGTPLRDLTKDKELRAMEAVRAASEAGREKIAGRAEAAQAATSSGKTIILNPGHGYYYDEVAKAWKLQRSWFFGIVEDFTTDEIALLTQNEIATLGATIRSTRDLNKSDGAGESGYPRWQECAAVNAKAVGAPKAVWSTGGNNYDRDIDARPLFANWSNGDLMISIHTNGGKGTGTETYYATDGAMPAESRRLAQILHQKVIGAIREKYDANWNDHQLRACSDCYGENRLATMPAALVEIAYGDTQDPDNKALQDSRFRTIVAQAIRDTVAEYYGGSTSGTAAAQMQTPASGSTLSGATQTFTWNAGQGVSQYFLYVGTSLAANNIYGNSLGTNTSATINNLPTNGSTIYVRLWSFINGNWQSNDYQYRAATTGSGGGTSGTAAAQMQTPASGSTLSGATQTFTWNAGQGVSQYFLYVGTSLAANNIYGNSLGTNTSATINNLPTNGSTIYVRLWSFINGNWQSNDYQYRTATR